MAPATSQVSIRRTQICTRLLDSKRPHRVGIGGRSRTRNHRGQSRRSGLLFLAAFRIASARFETPIRASAKAQVTARLNYPGTFKVQIIAASFMREYGTPGILERWRTIAKRQKGELASRPTQTLISPTGLVFDPFGGTEPGLGRACGSAAFVIRRCRRGDQQKGCHQNAASPAGPQGHNGGPLGS